MFINIDMLYIKFLFSNMLVKCILLNVQCILLNVPCILLNVPCILLNVDYVKRISMGKIYI